VRLAERKHFHSIIKGEIFMPHIGFGELIVILVIALIVFGPGKLPSVGAAVGKAFTEFRKASKELTGGGDANSTAVNEPAAVQATPAAAAPVAAAPVTAAPAPAAAPETHADKA
jgi:sec-independent protein translocase protein TatA